MSTTIRLCPPLLLDDQGSNLIEYALVAAILALCAVASTSHLATVLVGILNNIATAIASAV